MIVFAVFLAFLMWCYVAMRITFSILRIAIRVFIVVILFSVFNYWILALMLVLRFVRFSISVQSK